MFVSQKHRGFSESAHNGTNIQVLVATCIPQWPIWPIIPRTIPSSLAAHNVNILFFDANLIETDKSQKESFWDEYRFQVHVPQNVHF